MEAAFYKGTRPGLPGVYNRLVRWWTKGKYSHCEIVFGGNVCGSSSFMDGGVRLKQIEMDPAHWDFIDLPDKIEMQAMRWFCAHAGEKYDILGNLHFVIGGIGDDRNKWFCSEAIAAALNLTDPWRYDPAILFSTLQQLNQPRAGFFTSEGSQCR